ncbi:MAG: tRNA threonylcarbamoyladenosine dehydratase [Clostridia bacterium]|nr:tRNA threonylcarbamoyladenosine dehydratase [Clostridia bacterium]
METPFSRTELLLGAAAMKKLQNSRVIVFGVGGVGGYVVEALARSGVGAIDVVDNDVISVSNVNRQIIATTRNVGEKKVDVISRRIKEIDPNCKVTCHEVFVLPDTIDKFDLSSYDYVVDAIDTVSGKIAVIVAATNAGVPVISSMGAGNKLDPLAFEVADIYDTSVCPLAKVMRRELKKRGVGKLKVVYSKEPPFSRGCDEKEGDTDITDELDKTLNTRKKTPASIAFVPSVAGLIVAAEVIKDITGVRETRQISKT